MLFPEVSVNISNIRQYFNFLLIDSNLYFHYNIPRVILDSFEVPVRAGWAAAAPDSGAEESPGSAGQGNG